MKQKLTELKGKTDNSTVIIRNIKIPNFILARTTRQKINQETERFCNTISQQDLTYFYRTFYPPTVDTLFFCTCNMCKIDHMFGHESNLN